MSIELGDEVKDTVSGFKGVAVCRHSYLNGCDRITIQPKAETKGTSLPGECSFDEPQLVLVKAKVVPQGSKKTGGPERHKPTKKTTGRR